LISIAKKIATQSVDCHRVEAVEDAVADGKGQGQGLVTMAAPASYRVGEPSRRSGHQYCRDGHDPSAHSAEG
jgi:hypothetical protein